MTENTVYVKRYARNREELRKVQEHEVWRYAGCRGGTDEQEDGLKDLLKDLIRENTESGIPVQRPLFLHNEDDPRCYTEQFEYLLGEDVLVAPVWQAEQTERSVYLPEGEWIHLWTGNSYGQGDHTVPAPLGNTPVFYRKGSRWEKLMADIRTRFAQQH